MREDVPQWPAGRGGVRGRVQEDERALWTFDRSVVASISQRMTYRGSRCVGEEGREVRERRELEPVVGRACERYKVRRGRLVLVESLDLLIALHQRHFHSLTQNVHTSFAPSASSIERHSPADSHPGFCNSAGNPHQYQ